VANPKWRGPVHASSKLIEQKPAIIARHRPVSVAEIGFNAVLAEGRRAFIGATDSRRAALPFFTALAGRKPRVGPRFLPEGRDIAVRRVTQICREIAARGAVSDPYDLRLNAKPA
jgi:hypothetical protein